jgi:hypothetical protein
MLWALLHGPSPCHKFHFLYSTLRLGSRKIWGTKTNEPDGLHHDDYESSGR